MCNRYGNSFSICCSSTMNQSKTLISNWVEERQCAGRDEGNRCEDGTLSINLHRNGHSGILASGSEMQASSTAHNSYTSPQPCTVRNTGSREAALCSAAYEVVSQQVQGEFHPPPSPAEYISTTRTDYHKEFSSTRPPPTESHDISSEVPVSYWTQNQDKATGMTQSRHGRVLFGRNSAFSTPINHYTDQPLPHDLPF